MALGAAIRLQKREVPGVENVSKEFPSGTIACSEFPDKYGPISLSYLGYGGWAGIQEGGDYAALDSCEEGSYCSYSCPQGYAGTQWPDSQPDNGVSVGGLLCKNGFLTLTQPDSKYLCKKQGTTVTVRNELTTQNVSFCGTNYPGSEVPTNPNVAIASADGNVVDSPITVILASSYYQWQGKPTSTQFFVNAPGVSPQDGCIWGSADGNVGNWSPLNIGAGVDTNGVTYASIIPNPVGNIAEFTANISIEPADDNSSIQGNCSVINGVYSGSSGDAESNGCTVSVITGSAVIRIWK